MKVCSQYNVKNPNVLESCETEMGEKRTGRLEYADRIACTQIGFHLGNHANSR
jgi:hypothetical protein